MHRILQLSVLTTSAAFLPIAQKIERVVGARMPLVSIGTARGCPPNATVVEADVRMALSVGYRGVDTAHGDRCYDDRAVGRALKGVDRSSYYITTKIPSATDVDPAQTSEQLEASLQSLGLDYVDLMLIHHPGKWKTTTFEASVQQQWAALEAFYRAGKTRAIGVSNFCKRAMQAILQTATVMPAVNQVLYHAGMGEDPDRVVSFARAHNISIMAFSPTDQGNPAILSGEPYKSIGAVYNKTGIQVALRWLVQRGISLVVASDKREYQEEDRDIFDFELTPTEMESISAQTSCQAGGLKPPYCLPYWPGDNNCCNLDGKGTQCDSDLTISI